MKEERGKIQETVGKEKKPEKSKRVSGKSEKPKVKIEKRIVEFLFHAPEAAEVWLSGDFNEWDPARIPMKRNKEGVWKAKLRLIPGRYEYKVRADGQWVDYIRGVERVPNPFGTENFVMWVD